MTIIDRWTCHCCGDERPGPLIGVFKRVHHSPSFTVTENVRYCVDRPECVKAATEVRFYPVEDEEQG